MDHPEGAGNPFRHPSTARATAMHMTAITTETERKRLDRSVSSAENRAAGPKMTILGGLNPPSPGISAIAGNTRRTKNLVFWHPLAIIQPDGTPLGECRWTRVT